MTFTELDQADLDSPCRELFNGGLGIVAALLVRWQIDFSCVSTGGSIQLYTIQELGPDRNLMQGRCGLRYSV